MAKKKNTNYDFSGWATKFNIKCSDGRTILKNAFKHCDGNIVPLVWNHNHQSAENILGHALLENREEGVYAYCSFNDTEEGATAKELVKHGDIGSLSIYANDLQQDNIKNVIHGSIREVSLVLAGANPGAKIENVLTHSDNGESYDAAIITNDEELLHFAGEEDNLSHADANPNPDEDNKTQTQEKTVEDVLNTLTEEQKTVVYALIGAALEETGSDDNQEDEEEMKQNAFNNNTTNANDEALALVHDATKFGEIIGDAKKCGSMKEAFIAHGITNIDYLYPDYQDVNKVPGFINVNPSGWATKIMNGVHHTPFSRVKMTFADITADEARAKGYVKGEEKTDEVFTLLRRQVDPTTVYKKQSFDRDDIIDVTDFDMIPWVKGEMRLKLDEELARAFIFGDGRANSSRDKIKEDKIIPVIKDTEENLYAMVHEVTVPEGESEASILIDEMVRSLDNYEGSGNITFFTSAAYVTEMLLLKDENGRRIYKDIKELATAMLVDDIVKVPANFIPSDTYGVALDLNDYNVGADKGGAVNMFDDFDIDYNKEKYLIETRCSGALIKPHSAVVLKKASE